MLVANYRMNFGGRAVMALGRTLRKAKRRLKWVARLIGLFTALFAYELSQIEGYEPDILGAADPYLAAVVGYVVGQWIVFFAMFWFVNAMREIGGYFLRRS